MDWIRILMVLSTKAFTYETNDKDLAFMSMLKEAHTQARGTWDTDMVTV